MPSSSAADPVSEVSYLSINAAGERQPYLGSTSGILFADLLKSSVDIPVSRRSSEQASLTPGAEQSIVSTVQAPRAARNREDLPPQQLATKLVAAYLEHDNVSYPFIFPYFLIETLERVYSDPGYYTSRASPFEVYVFNMVLAVSTIQVYKYDWQSLPSAESHHIRAMAEINPVLAHGSIEALQALLLLVQYRTGSSIKDNSASMWHTIGIALRMSLELGLHRESAYPLKRTSDLDASKLHAYRSQELARRCFWSVICFDRITSNILGRPLGIQDEDIDTALPTEDIDNLLTRPLAATIAGVQRIAVFNKIVKYRLFCGKLLTTLHRKRAAHLTAEDALKIRDELADELDQWYSGLQDLQLPDPNTPESQQLSCFVTSTWYEVLYANATLMIWRPCPLLSDIANDRLMLQRIYDSAVHAINIYAILHRSRQINYSWVTLQSVFLAGLSYIYAGRWRSCVGGVLTADASIVSRHIRDRQNPSGADACQLDHDPATIDVVNITRACSNVLVAVAERWNTQRHCHEVFDRLSDAVLADAIKLKAAPSLGQGHTPQSESSVESATSIPQHPFSSQPQLTSPDRVAFWNQNGQQQASYPAGTMTTLPLAVDNEFMHCYDDLLHFHNQQQLEDPIMHLSQDWMVQVQPQQYVTNPQYLPNGMQMQ